MHIEKLPQQFTICKVRELSADYLQDEFCFIGKTDEEVSLVCRTDRVPQRTEAREDGWRALRIQGTLDFSLVGTLAELSRILAEEKIGIFAVSTYNTDYILTKEADFDRAVLALEKQGHQVVSCSVSKK